MWNPKAEAVRLWDADPCGSVTGGFREGSPEFFAAVDVERYQRYAPWLPEAVGFDECAGLHVLEVGCGMGTDLAQFSRHGAVAVGLDLTPHHLRLAKTRLHREGPSVRLVRADAERLPFRAASLDVVYSFGVLHHTPEVGAAIDEIRRVLKPNGRIILGLYHRHSVFYWFFTIFLRGIVRGLLLRKGYRSLMADIERHDHSNALPLVRVYSRRQVRKLLGRFQFVSIRTHHLDAIHFSYLGVFLRRIPRLLLERYGRRWGWYLVAKAWK